MITKAIKEAKYKGAYKIELLFSDGFKREIDFKSFLENANNPMTTKYLDKKLFQSFSIEYGDVVWNNYEMCFPIWDLYEGNIS